MDDNHDIDREMNQLAEEYRAVGENEQRYEGLKHEISKILWKHEERLNVLEAQRDFLLEKLGVEL